MALTFTDAGEVKNRPVPVGQALERVVDVQFDNSYPTGGEAVAAADVGLRRITGVDVMGSRTAAATLSQLTVDLLSAAATGGVKLLILTGATAEVGNGSDQSGKTYRLKFIGI